MGKPKHSDDPRGEQKGAVERDIHDHGDKAYQARKDEINDHHQQRGGTQGKGERAAGDPRADGSDADDHERMIARSPADADGGHRLYENRTQHDEAEKNSEKNRRDIDMRRHGHDNEEFQGRGGHAGSVHHHDDSARVKSTGQGGGNRSDEDRGQKRSN